MRGFLVGAALTALTSGCGTRLVFVEYTYNLRPQEQAGACPVAANDKVENQLAAGDGFRDQLLAPLTLPKASGRGAIVEMVVDDGRRQMQAEIDRRYLAFRQAIACYELALGQDRSRSYAYLNEAVVNMRMADFIEDEGMRGERYTHAQNALSRAAELNRYDGQTVYYQAELYVRRRNYPLAEKALKELIDKKWNRAHVHNLLGWVYLQTNRQQAANDEWVAASQIDRPAAATEWAINNTHTPPRNKFEDPADEEEPIGYYEWDYNKREPREITTPPRSACGWASNGRPRCGN